MVQISSSTLDLYQNNKFITQTLPNPSTLRFVVCLALRKEMLFKRQANCLEDTKTYSSKNIAQ